MSVNKKSVSIEVPSDLSLEMSVAWMVILNIIGYVFAFWMLSFNLLLGSGLILFLLIGGAICDGDVLKLNSEIKEARKRLKK